MEHVMLTGLGLLFATLAAPAQPFLYNETKTFQVKGITYQCDLEDGIVAFYNKIDQFTYVDKTYKDGSELPEEIARGHRSGIKENFWLDIEPKINGIVNSTLSPQEKALIKDWAFVIILKFPPLVGSSPEVTFNFVARSPYGQISPLTYSKLERKLANNVRVTFTDVGRELNFVPLIWSQEVK
ncbi:MAG: DUF5043 domain-containing protein [Odoribacteraceae bacterium]|jgi:hypothetical protein|nr:DUF5043 domain-containing protein [Odoribacteraceae bacterium]